ncbi:MAG: putative Ig domain-containing protein, partial [Acidobacteriota bacterium]
MRRSLVRHCFHFFPVLTALCLNLFAQPLTVTTGDLDWSIGRVEASLDATGGTGPYTWSLTLCNIPGISLRTDVPAGWTATAGLIGVATTPGTYSCGVQVTSGAETASKTFTVKVYGFVMTSNWEFPDGSVGVAYSQQITTVGGTAPVSFNLALGPGLPPGLTLDTATGVISGAPTTPGLYDFQVNISEATWTFGRGMRIYISPMRITSPATLPNGTQNVAYSQTIAVSGGTAPYTFGLHCSGAPGGLSLNSSTGVLSGTPTGPGYWSFQVRITDNAGAELRKHYTLGVVGVPLTVPYIRSWPFDDFVIGQQSDWRSADTNGGKPPYTFSLFSGALPAGITLQTPADLRPCLTNPGVLLAGTPTALGPYTFALQATDSSAPAQTTGRLHTVRVSPLSPENLPDGTLGVAYSQKLRVIGGTPPYTLSIVEGQLPNGLSMDSSGQVTGTPTETSWWFWFRLRVTDAAGNSYTGGHGIRINGTSPTHVQINDGPDLGQVGPGQSYSRTFSACCSAGSYTWTLEPGSTLPGSLTLSSGGTLSGNVPATAGAHVFTVRATDGSGNFGLRTFRLNVASIYFSVSNVLPHGNVSAAYSATLAVSSATGTVTWSVKPGHAVPAGLVLNTSTGVISGTPTAVGNYFFDVIATDSGTGGTTTISLTLVVYPAGMVPPLYITTTDQQWSIGRVETPLDAVGGTGTYTWSLTSCSIPGIALRTDVSSGWTAKAGLLGVATTPGTYSCGVQVTSGAQTASKTISVKVSGLVVTSNWEFPDGSVGVAYSQTITTAGGTGTVSFALQPGSLLPTGLSLNPTTGDITGPPTVAGNYDFNVNITDSTGTFTRNMRIYISPMRITSPAT